MAMAMKAVRAMVADMFRCPDCKRPKVEIAADWKGRGNGRSGEAVHVATRFGGEVCTCPPKPLDGAVVGTIAPRVLRTWDCRNCGAGVDEMIDGCLLCGYERKKCTSCEGTGVIDSGPHPVGCVEPCNNCDEGYYYPPVAAVAPVEDPNDCAGCGAAPAPRDDEGNATYPQYRAGKETGAGYCGMCARNEGFKP